MIKKFTNLLEGAIATAKNHQANATKAQIAKLVAMYADVLGRAETAEAEVAALRARVAELEAAVSASSGAVAALDEIESLMWGEDDDD